MNEETLALEVDSEPILVIVDEPASGPMAPCSCSPRSG